jgi:hypothetical protein
LISKRNWHVRDKWKRHLALAGNRQLSMHIPPTQLFNSKRVSDYFKRYRIVFLKPVNGTFGNNIVKVTQGKGNYLVHREKMVKRVAPNQITGELIRSVRGRPYLVQKGVPLLTIKGQPIDFRVLVLKPDKRWDIMGTMGKVASANRIVTNYNHGGRPIRVGEALRQVGWTQKEISNIQARMNRVSLLAARTFNQRYPHCRRLGIDIAIDANKRIWILEVNTNPFFELFRFHENKQLYGKIKRL